MLKFFSTFYFIFFFLPLSLLAQEPIKEVNTDFFNSGSRVTDFLELNDKLVFPIYTSETGREFFISDGTISGTKILKDIYPGSESSLSRDEFNISQNYAVLDSNLYFIAYEPNSGYGLWKTDGSSQNTQLIYPHIGNPVYRLVSDGSQLFFISGDAPRPDTRSFTCWKSDGTNSGTQVVRSGITNSLPPEEVGFSGGNFFFVFASEIQDEFKLWRSDGTEQGTFLLRSRLKSLGLNDNSNLIGSNANLNQNWYFLAKDTSGFAGIWETDGTIQGTILLDTIPEVSNSNNYVRVSDVLLYNGKLYWLFFIEDGVFVYECDGTETGTIEIFSKSSTEAFGISGLAIRNDSLLFLAPNTDQSVKNTAVYQFDFQSHLGLIKSELELDANYPSGSGNRNFRSKFLRNSNNDWLLLYQNRFIDEVWIASDSNFVFEKDEDVRPVPPAIVFENEFYFSNRFPAGIGEISAHSGSLGIYRPVSKLENNSHTIFPEENFRHFFPTDSLYFFSGLVGFEREVFVSDGTIAGTNRVIDLDEFADASPAYFTAFKGKVVFRAFTLDTGQELWITDGSANGTILLDDTKSGPNSSFPDKLTVVGDSLYYYLRFDRELWLTDGTPGNASMLTNFGNGGSLTRSVNQIFPFKNGLLISVESSLAEKKWELWRSDGSMQGTVLVDSAFESIKFLGQVGDFLILEAYNQNTGLELWKTNGFPNGTTLLKDICQGGKDSRPSNGIVYKGELYFTANDSIHGREIWKTDGTDVGTQLLKDIQVGPKSGVLQPNFFVWKDSLFFQASDGVNGAEIWVTDGSSAGTNIFADLVPGSGSSYPHNFANSDSTLFFAAYTDQNGVELWGANAQGFSQLVLDISPGPQHSNPFGGGFVNGSFLFFADKDTLGREIFKTDKNVITKVFEPLIESPLSVFPNPTNGFLKIRNINGSTMPLKVSIFSVDGRFHSSKQILNNGLNLSDLRQGVYLLIFEYFQM